jgi:hypothetical protein
MNEAFEIIKFNKQLKKLNKLNDKLKSMKLNITSTEQGRIRKVTKMLDTAIRKLNKVRDDFKSGKISRNQAKAEITKSKDKLKSTMRYLKQKDIIGLVGDAASYRLVAVVQSIVSMLVLGGLSGASLLLAWEEEAGDALIEHRQKMSLREMFESPEAKKAYREIAKKNHPDLKKGDPELMKAANALKASVENKDKEMFKLAGKKPKKSYDDTKKEDDILLQSAKNYQSLVTDFFHNLNGEFANQKINVKFHGIVRRKKDGLDLSVTVHSPGGVISAFMPDIQKIKGSTNFTNKLDKFIIEKIFSQLKK